MMRNEDVHARGCEPVCPVTRERGVKSALVHRTWHVLEMQETVMMATAMPPLRA